MLVRTCLLHLTGCPALSESSNSSPPLFSGVKYNKNISFSELTDTNFNLLIQVKGLDRARSYLLGIIFIKMPTPSYPLSQRQSSKCHLCVTLPLCRLCTTRQQREPDAELGIGPEINNLFPGIPGYVAGNNSSSGGRGRSPKQFSRNSSFLTSLQREAVKSDLLRTRTVDFVRNTLNDISHSSAF